MKLRSLLVAALVVFGLGLIPAAGAAPAAVNATLVADDISYILGGTPLNQETALAVGGSGDPGGDVTKCISQYETFLKFDLSTMPSGEAITGATLTFRSLGPYAGSLNLTMRLYGSTVTDWSEGAGQIPWASRPITGAVDFQTTVAVLTPSGSDFAFNSTPQLVAFLNQQLTVPGKLVTLWITPTTCNYQYSRQYMASKETTGANAVPAQLALTTTPATSTVSGDISVVCKNGVMQYAAGTVDIGISSSDGSYAPPTFMGVVLGSFGSFSVPIPTDKCTTSGVCSMTLANVANLTNLAPGVLCPANGDLFVYPPGAGWTYMNQPAKPFQNVVLAAAGVGPMNAIVGTFEVVPGANPNAVTLSTFRAANPAVNWPLIAAALLLVAALAGFGIYRRRLSQVRAR
ncbi:MAG: hypothetical protein NT169_23520 [Chloroflexi bacterium]|nr:hypothetical protein [Chloroflexota bacterium]